MVIWGFSGGRGGVIFLLGGGNGGFLDGGGFGI